MKEVTEDRESLLSILNDAYKRSAKAGNLAKRKWEEIEVDFSDPEALAVGGMAAAKILQLSLDATDKIIKIATILKDVVIDKKDGTDSATRDMNSLMAEAMDELEKEES